MRMGQESEETVLQRVKFYMLMEVGSMYQVVDAFADLNASISPSGNVSLDALAYTYGAGRFCVFDLSEAIWWSSVARSSKVSCVSRKCDNVRRVIEGFRKIMIQLR
jgi:hypothetical protein